MFFLFDEKELIISSILLLQKIRGSIKIKFLQMSFVVIYSALKYMFPKFIGPKIAKELMIFSIILLVLNYSIEH